MIEQLRDELSGLESQHARRSRRPVQAVHGSRLRIADREMLAFGSNDYLGLAQHPELVKAITDAAQRYGVGARASHLLSGHFAVHDQVEQELAAWVGFPRALLFSAGYLANLGVITALLRQHDAIFADRLNHASLYDAAVLCRAELRRYRHGDCAQLEKLLGKCRAPRKLICTDAVFSMDGDLAPLPDLLQLAERYDAWLLVDDAHGFGVLGEGRGSLAHFGLRSERVIYMGTLGKAAGVFGAFIAADEIIIEYLINRARTYIYTTAVPPLIAHVLLKSLELIRTATASRSHLFALIEYFRAALAASPWRLAQSGTAIQPLIIGDNPKTVELSDTLWKRGIWVPAIRPPTVPKGSARLRITLTALHSRQDIECLVNALL